MNLLLYGDCRIVMREQLKEKYFYACVTSPPYWGLRDYGIPPSEWPEVSYSPMPGLPAITVPAWTGCLGLEPTPEMFVGHMVLVFREVWRVLRDDGTLWLNFGDTYISTAPGTMGDNIHIEGTLEATRRARKIERRKVPEGLKPKDLVGIPWRVAFALQADGWYLRMDNIWHKSNPMPESVVDRTTKAHEYVFLLSKRRKYYFDINAIKEPAVGFNNEPVAGSMAAFGPQQARRRKGNSKTFRGGGKYTQGQSFDNSTLVERESNGNVANQSGLRNKRSVWTVATTQFSGAHFATFPKKIPEICVLAGCPIGGSVLDPFGGSGTTREVALANNRECTLIDINPEYIKIQEKRTAAVQTNLF